MNVGAVGEVISRLGVAAKVRLSERRSIISLEGFHGTLVPPQQPRRAIASGAVRLLIGRPGSHFQRRSLLLPSVGAHLGELLILPDGLLEVLSQPDALLSVRLVLHEHLIDLGHFDTSLDLLDLDIALVKLAALLADRPLVAIDELVRLGMLLLTA